MTPTALPPTATFARRALRWAGRLVFILVLLAAGGWAGMALWFQLPAPPALRAAAIGACALLTLWVVQAVWRRRHAGAACIAYAAAMAALLLWWATIAPLQQRDWADDVARLLDARVQGSQLTLDNVRDFDWRSETDYTPRWVQRQYDLDTLQSVDVAMSYWMGPAIAHTLVSFGFADGRFVTFSLEIRKERGEQFSAVGGFFKQFEATLVAAEERDILGVRAHARGEDVYLYRVQMPPAAMRSLLLGYVDTAQQLRRTPRFYNTLTGNCTTVVFEMARRIEPGLPVDARLLASGYLPGYLQDVGALTPGVPLDVLRSQGRITDRAQAVQAAPEAFSRAIRAGIPGMQGATQDRTATQGVPP